MVIRKILSRIERQLSTVIISVVKRQCQSVICGEDGRCATATCASRPSEAREVRLIHGPWRSKND